MLKGLHHIVLMCQDTEASRRWYEKVGFRYLRGFEGMHWFGLGDVEIMLHPSGKGSGGLGLAFHAEVPDVDGFFREIVSRGLQPVDSQDGRQPLDAPVTRPWGDREFDLFDPDGHLWSFTKPAGS